uniref:Uncharacterized protein n=1 Tax=Ovis aries TaxID=9940 RepID=A0AC11D1W7_SHEEP
MRPRPGQGAREAPRGQRGVPRQPWPLILLGLASHPVGAHGLLPPTAVPRNPAPRMEAPSGKSPWSLWGRSAQVRTLGHPVPALHGGAQCQQGHRGVSHQRLLPG